MKQSFFKSKKFKIILAIFLLLLIAATVLFFFFYKELKKEKGRSLIGNKMNINFPAQTIKSDLTRFFIETELTKVETIKARLKYKAGPREIKLGVKGGEKQKYVYQTFYQKLLQGCDWEKITEGQDILYQKTKKYNFLSELLDDLPAKDKIAVYKSKWPQIIQMSLEGEPRQINPGYIKQTVGLRGSNTFIIGVDKSPFIFKLSKQDINARVGEDKYLVSLSKNGRLIDEKAIFDDGFTGKEKLKKEPQSVEFKLENTTPGIYEILAEFEGEGSDAFITSIETNQPKMVIKNNGYLWNKNPVTLYTNNASVIFKVSSKEYLQTIKLNDNIPLAIKKEGEKYTFDLPKLDPGASLYKLEIPNPFMSFASTGYFSFSPEQYFDPKMIYGVDLNSLDSLEQIDYILTSVPKASQEGDWLVSEIVFEAQDIKVDEDKKIYFSLEMLGLEKDKEELVIDSFEIEVRIPGLLDDNFSKKKTPSLLSPISQDTSSDKPVATLTPVSSLNKNLKIKVLNAGAPAGYAKKYADLISNAGYLNVEAGNALGEKIQDAKIAYPKTAEADIKLIENILKNKYKNVEKIINNDNSEIIINIGALFAIVTPTVAP